MQCFENVYSSGWCSKALRFTGLHSACYTLDNYKTSQMQTLLSYEGICGQLDTDI